MVAAAAPTLPVQRPATLQEWPEEKMPLEAKVPFAPILEEIFRLLAAALTCDPSKMLRSWRLTAIVAPAHHLRLAGLDLTNHFGDTYLPFADLSTCCVLLFARCGEISSMWGPGWYMSDLR